MSVRDRLAPASVPAVERRKGGASFPAVDGRRWLVLVGVLVAIGIAARVVQYARNPSLSVDESLLALNVMRRSVSGLLGTLDFNQAAPPGFLVLEKGATAVLGRGEFWLRLVPLAAGVGAMVAFPFLARQVVGRTAAVLAVGLFALSDSVIYYAGTGKQYSLDVLAVVALSWLALRAFARDSRGRFLGLVIAGTVAVWLSHPAAFVLFAIGATLLFRYVRRRDWQHASVALASTLLWLGSFTVSYVITRPSVTHVERSYSGSTSFVGGGGNTTSALHDYFGLFRYAVGIPHDSFLGMGDPGHWAAGVAAALFVVGFAVLCMRKPQQAAVLFVPAALAVIASALHRYPLVARTVVFAAPAAVVGVAAGLMFLAGAARRSISWPVTAAAAGIVIVALAVPAARGLDHPRTKEELKPVLRFLAHSERSGDVLYLYYTTQYGFRYYLSCGCFDRVTEVPRRQGLWPLTRYVGGSAQWAPALVSRPPSFIVGQDSGEQRSKVVADLRGLAGHRRVWIILANLPSADRRFLLGQLDELGRQSVAFQPGSDESAAGVYRYDLK